MHTRLWPFGPLILLAVVIVSMSREGSVTAQSKAAPVAVEPQSPTINVPFPLGVQRGQTLDLTLTGANLTDPTAVLTSFPAKVTIPTDMNNGKEAAKLRVKLEVPADAPIGFHTIRVATKHGISNVRIFCVDELPQIDEAADNKSIEKAQVVPVPGVVVGRTDAEVSDFFKFAVKPGQRLTFDVLGHRLGSQLDPVIKLYEAKTGKELAGHYSDDEPGLQSDARLTQVFPSGGEYVIEVRDSRHLGGGESYYRLRIADVPAAIAAMPVAIKKGAKATIQFTGRNVEGVAPIEVTMPVDRASINVAPKGPGGSGWPVQVLASDVDEIVELEPNNDIAKANRIQVPSGVTGRFFEKGDVDHFVFSGKKGVKYTIEAATYEILSPAEVYLIVKDMKGADLAKSNPANTPARIDFTPAADGDFIIYAEHLNFLFGPTEVYHLTIQQAGPDFEVQAQLDRLSVAPGETTLLPIAPATRREFTGPIELTVTGHPGFSGTVTIPNTPPTPPNQTPPPVAYLPIACKGDVPLGAYSLRIVAKGTVNGKEITRLATVTNVVKAGLNNLTFPPPEMLASVAVAVTDKPLFSLSVKIDKAELLRGVAANVTVTAKRAAGFTDAIQLAPLTVPANVAIAMKPIPQGANEVTFPITPAANAGIGAIPLSVRGTAKVGGKGGKGGKDYAFYSAPATANIVLPVEVKAEPSPLMLKTGQKAKLKVTIVRKGGYKGPVNLEVKNLPANVTAPKITIAMDKNDAEIELSAAPAAAAGDKPDVQITATATGAANQVSTSPNVLLKVSK